MECFPCKPFGNSENMCRFFQIGEEMVMQEQDLAWAAAGGVPFPEH